MMEKKGVLNLSIRWILIIILIVIAISIIATVVIYKVFVKTPQINSGAGTGTTGTLSINVRDDVTESDGKLNINVVGNESK